MDYRWNDAEVYEVWEVVMDYRRIITEGRVRWWSLRTHSWAPPWMAEGLEESRWQKEQVRGGVREGDATLVKNPVSGDYVVVDRETGSIVDRIRAEDIALDEDDLHILGKESLQGRRV